MGGPIALVRANPCPEPEPEPEPEPRAPSPSPSPSPSPNQVRDGDVITLDPKAWLGLGLG